MRHIGAAGADRVGKYCDVNVLGVAPLNRVAVPVEYHGLVHVRHWIEMAVVRQEPADGELRPAVVQHAELQPPFIRVVRASWERVPHPSVADDDIHGHLAAGCQDRRLSVGSHDGRAAERDGEDIHAELLVAQEVLDPSDGFVVAADERQGGIDGEEAVGPDSAVLGRDVAQRGGLRRHVTVLTRSRRVRQVKSPRCIQRDSAVVPIVELILAAEPAVVVHRRRQAHLVTGGAERALPKRRGQHLPLVDGGLRLEGGIVQPGAQGTGPRSGIEVWVFLFVRDVVVGVARAVVDVVDGVTRQTRQPRLCLHARPVDLERHGAGKHEGRIVAPAAPLALHPPDAVCDIRKPLDVPINPRVRFGGVSP